MSANSKPPCQLQMAMKRRLVAYPKAFCIEQDICDVTLWLIQKFRVPSVHLWVDRHYVHNGRKISGVTAMRWHRHPDSLTPAANEAFLALGYEISDTGADIYAYQPCNGNHSRHDAMRAFGRVEVALRDWANPL